MRGRKVSSGGRGGKTKGATTRCFVRKRDMLHVSDMFFGEAHCICCARCRRSVRCEGCDKARVLYVKVANF